MNQQEEGPSCVWGKDGQGTAEEDRKKEAEKSKFSTACMEIGTASSW